RFNLKKIEYILTEIKESGNLQGVLLSSREGNLISKVFDQNFEANEFSAMTASVIDSAEDLMNTVSETYLDKIITELEDQSVIILDCHKNAFIVLFVGDESKVDEIFKNINNYIEKIMEVY
ncbi:MAG: roadblock/LC7 domain-containing protein, partial [Promethearchaeota archaeon]